MKFKTHVKRAFDVTGTHELCMTMICMKLQDHTADPSKSMQRINYQLKSEYLPKEV